jgi:hypothetical protein
VKDIALRYVFQGEDCPRHFRSVSFESQRDWDKICMVPDLYYFLARGYEDFLPKDATLPAWEGRNPQVIWRGSTTGATSRTDVHAIGFTAETLDLLPRYQLCRILQQLNDGADAGIVAIVQCPDGDKEAVTARLAAERLAANFVPTRDMMHYKYLVEIDGNTSSWNFIQRLRLGCCILKVESPWVQWFSHRIEPWVHYVPVRADLGDLLEKVDWCRTHDREAGQIAANGRAFGLGVTYDAEMRQAALDIIRTSIPLSGDPADLAAAQELCAAADRLRPAWDAAIDAWLSFPEPVWLQTCHGTVLGADRHGTLIQLSPDGDLSQAITLHDGDDRWRQALRGLHIDREGGTLLLERDGLLLCAEPHRATMVCDRLEPREWETFTLVPATR